MAENTMNMPMSEKIKEFLRKPLIICVTPEQKGDNFLKGEDDSSSNSSGSSGSSYETSGWNTNARSNSNTGWNEDEWRSGCSPCCSPCSPCIPNTNRNQCGPDDNRCYPNCLPCNPCYPCLPVEENDRDRG